MNRIRIVLGVVLASGLIALLLAPAISARQTSRRVTTTTVIVVMKEFKFILSRKTVPHGKVIFVLENKGHLAHNFAIGFKKSANIGPGKKGNITIALAKGLHPYKCTVDSHARFGMKGTLRVT